MQSTTAISQVRFANPQVGWAFGGSIQQTTDGGRTWHPYSHAGGTVLDVETDGTSVVVASASGCVPQGCTGPLQVARASIADAGACAAVTVDGGRDGGGRAAVLDAQIQLDKQHVLVLPTWAGRSTGVMELTSSGLVPIPAPRPCAGGAHLQVVLTAQVGGHGPWFGLCGTREPGATTVVATLTTSTDQGRSWQLASSGALDLDPARVHLAASDGTHLVAVADEPADGSSRTDDLIRVSHDGGRTWAAPVAPGGPWQWVGAPGGSELYAVSAADGAIHRSTDHGDHWTGMGSGG